MHRGSLFGRSDTEEGYRCASSSSTAPIEFHATSWHSDDVLADDGDDDDGELNFVIKAFGVDATGRSVSATMTGFSPFFYAKIEPSWSESKTRAVFREIQETGAKLGMMDVRAIKRKDFWGFSHGTEVRFWRLQFRTIRGMRITASNLSKKKIVRLYESNMDPLLRMFHIRGIEPAGWIRVKQWSSDVSSMPSTCEVDIQCSWLDVEPMQRTDMAPLLIAAFDIECNSAHGDFPVAIKDYRRLAIDLQSLCATRSIKSESRFAAYELIKRAMRHALGIETCEDSLMSRLEFKRSVVDHAAMDELVNKYVDDVYTCLVSKVDVDDGANGGDEEDTAGMNPALCKLVRLFNSIFGKKWPLKGDEVIQIGTTINVFGRDCSFRSIMTLGSCEQISEDNTDVASFDNEGDMLLAWVDMMIAIDPDIVVGYNIMGFDMAYMHDRAKEVFGRDRSTSVFCRLGRLKSVTSSFVEKKLSSSALGDNVLRYLDMHGRVIIDVMKVVQRDHKLDSYKLDAVAEHFTGEKKNDVSPKDIFRLQRGTAADRRVIAEYCIQDCVLCNRLVAKLQMVPNNMGMANVCSVPLTYILMRGQGIKIFSLVAKQCRDDGFLIPTQQAATHPHDGTDGYEGAIVLQPQEGMYLDNPVAVLDYASLYPSSMISENLSHDSLVMDPQFDNLPGVAYVTVEYQNGVVPCKCRFAQVTTDGKSAGKAVLPRILQHLVAQRKATRERMTHVVTSTGTIGVLVDDGRAIVSASDKRRVVLDGDDSASCRPAYDSFQLAVLDGLQNAYKVTANSLYGQMGSVTSPLYLKHIAACTTSVGRSMILKARAFMEKEMKATVVYGDTDSIFCVFPESKNLVGRDAIAATIAAGQHASRMFRPQLKAPHDLEYEKTFYPFILLSKKRYVGLLYESDPDAKGKQKSMGIVLKRRDNAPIVKRTYGGIIDILLHQRDVPASIKFLDAVLRDLAKGSVDMNELIVSKTLKSTYKDPTRIAHNVLAVRMGQRDPGNKPQSNDRIPYVYIENKEATLQGDRIEHPDYVRAHGLKLDYHHYITNQIMKPVLQIYALPGVLEMISGHKSCVGGNSREKEVERLLFSPYLRTMVNNRNGQREITSFFSTTKRIT